MLPKLSIVMPVLNREDTIEKAICSVLDQQYPNLEFIILDGGSNDKTVEIIKRYQHRITYWHSKYDGNPVAAINASIEMATGELIGILMADDWYEPQTLSKVADALLLHPDADVITCAGRIVTFDQKTNAYRPFMVYDSESVLRLSFSNICFGVSAICTRFIKKSLYQQIGLYSPYDSKGRYVFSNDKEFLLRAVLHGVKNHYIDHLGHTYLAHTSSATFGNNQANILRLCEEHMETADVYLKTKKLSTWQRLLLNYWRIDQSVRLVLYHLLAGKWREAYQQMENSAKESPFFWPLGFWVVTSKILAKKSARFVRKKLIG